MAAVGAALCALGRAAALCTLGLGENRAWGELQPLFEQTPEPV